MLPTICGPCPWNAEIESDLFDWMFHYIRLQDGGCPIGRHELRDEHWHLLATIREGREEWFIEVAKQEAAEEKLRNGNN